MGKAKKRTKSKSSPDNKGSDQNKRVAVERDRGLDPDLVSSQTIHTTTPTISKPTMQQQTPQNQAHPQFQIPGDGSQQQTPNFGLCYQNYATPPQYPYVNQNSPSYNMPVTQGILNQTQPVTSDQFTQLMKRFDKIEKSLERLDSIQSTVNKITVRIDKIDTNMTSLQNRMSDLENSRSHDSQSIEEISKKQKDIECMLSKMKNIEQKQRDNERELKSDILDLKTRSMRDNLLFFGIPEEANETDSNCVEKVLQLIQTKCEIENAQSNVKLHRAHRIGRYNPAKTRPIVAKFAFYQDREHVRSSAQKLSKPYGISQQYPREVMETRRRLVPIMKQARSENKDAYISVDKLYINGRLYRESEEAR